MREIRLTLPAPHVNQLEVMEHPSRWKVLPCGRRWGKSTLGEIWTPKPAIDGYPVAWFAPTYKLLADVWRDIKALYAPITKDKSETEHRLELITGGVVDMWSLDNPDAGRGRKYKRVFVDEAGMVPKLEEAWTEGIRPTLSDFVGDAAFAGTPKGRNYFWRLFSLGLDPLMTDWASWQMPTTANPYIQPSEVEAARELLPDRAFRQEYLAEFIEESGGVFRRVAEAVDTGRSVPSEPDKSLCYYMGVDLARVNDFTVISVFDMFGRQVYFERFNQVDWVLQIEAIVRVAKRYDAHTVIDSTGVGDPIREALGRRDIKIEGVYLSNTSKGELIDRLAVMIERDRLRLMDVPVQTNELMAYEYEITPSGNVRTNAPEGMHDDTVMANALAVKWVPFDTPVLKPKDDYPPPSRRPADIRKRHNWGERVESPDEYE